MTTTASGINNIRPLGSALPLTPLDRSFDEKMMELDRNMLMSNLGSPVGSPDISYEEHVQRFTKILREECETYFEELGYSLDHLCEDPGLDFVNAVTAYAKSIIFHQQVATDKKKRNRVSDADIGRSFPKSKLITFRPGDFEVEVPDQDITIDFQKLLQKCAQEGLTVFEKQALCQNPRYKLHILKIFLSTMKHTQRNLSSLSDSEFWEDRTNMRRFDYKLCQLNQKCKQETAELAERNYNSWLDEPNNAESPQTQTSSVSAAKKRGKKGVKGKQPVNKVAAAPVGFYVPRVINQPEAVKSLLQTKLDTICARNFNCSYKLDPRVQKWAGIPSGIEPSDPSIQALFPEYQGLTAAQFRIQCDNHNLGDAMRRLLSDATLVQTYAYEHIHINAKGIEKPGLTFAARKIDSNNVDSDDNVEVGPITVAWYMKKGKPTLYHVGFKRCQNISPEELKQEKEQASVGGAVFHNVRETAMRAGKYFGIEDVIVLKIGPIEGKEVTFYIPPLTDSTPSNDQPVYRE